MSEKTENSNGVLKSACVQYCTLILPSGCNHIPLFLMRNRGSPHVAR